MNKEEKEAIEIVKEIRKSDLMSAEFDIEELYNAIQTTLNLIDKLQKDNYELDRESQHFFDRIQDLQKQLDQLKEVDRQICCEELITKDKYQDILKENEELKEQRNKLLQKDFKFLTENYVHKDIIKYKINELKKAPVVYSLTIDILEELLEEIFGAESDIE